MDFEEILNLQLAEVELLEAAYGNELNMESCEELEAMRISQNGQLKLVKPSGIRFSIRLESYGQCYYRFIIMNGFIVIL